MSIAKSPLISVGMPVYNGERHISQAIDSILAQTCTDWELVICDNASTDNTYQICRGYADRDPRIRLFRNEKNMGSVYNDNAVFKYATGKYFKWASANDFIHPTMLARCSEILENDPTVVLCYSSTGVVDSQGKLLNEITEQYRLDNQNPAVRFQGILHMDLNNAFSGLIRSDVLRRTKYIGNYIASDLPVMAELALRGRYYSIEEPLFFRRMGDESATIHKTMEELKVFHDPSSAHKKRMKLVRLHWEYLRAAHSVWVGIGQHCRICTHLAKFTYWNRHALFAELKQAISS